MLYVYIYVYAWTERRIYRSFQALKNSAKKSKSLPFPGLLAASQKKWWLWQFLSHPPQPRTLLHDCKIKMLANGSFSLPLSITEKDLSWLRPSKAAQSASVERSTDLLRIQEQSEITWNHMSWIASMWIGATRYKKMHSNSAKSNSHEKCWNA